jgi:putative ABC transport system permease protein
MTLWLLLTGTRRAPRRLLLASVGVAFPVAVFAAGLMFLGLAVRDMTKVTLAPIKLEQRALATTLDVNMTAIGRKLATVPGVARVDRFAAADVVVRPEGVTSGMTARLFAVDPSYIRHHPWVRVVSGALGRGALLSQTLRSAPGFGSARHVTLSLAGSTSKLALRLPAAGTVDLRDTLAAWFAIPIGEVQGDEALVPRAIVIDYNTFEHSVLPTLKAQLGTATPVLNPGLTDLPPVSLEAHVTLDHASYPADPGQAAVWSTARRHLLERQAPGSIVVADDAYQPLTEASSDAANALTLFILLGLPGVLAAAALALAAQSALADAHRREDALLRLRGATDGQLIGLAAANAGLAWVIGSVTGLVVAGAAVTAVTGRLVWDGVAAGKLALAIGLPVAAGALTTGVRLIGLLRAGGRPQTQERRRLQAGWQPLWRRAWLDVAALATGVAILGVSAATGGLKPVPVDPSQGSTLALRFYILLGLVFLWLGTTLLAVRVLVSRAARASRPGQAGLPPSWRAMSRRWLGRRPARAAVAMVLGALAVAFGTEVVSFVSTYRTATRTEAAAAFGSDLRITAGDPTKDLPPLLRSDVAAITPVRIVPVRAGSDRKSMMALDASTYRQAVTSPTQIVSGGGFAALRDHPHGMLIAKEIATDFEVKPGDPLPLTLFPDDKDQSRNVTYRVAGIFRSVPPSAPVTEMVISTAGLPPYLLRAPDFYLARTPPGVPPRAVAARLRRGSFGHAASVITVERLTRETRSLTALNLAPLAALEAAGAGLIAAIGVAVLGAFLVLERRREAAILEAVGADAAQIRTGPVQEGLLAVATSVVIGVPLGLMLGLLAVRVLGLFFTLPPPLLDVPVVALIVFVVLMAAASALALAAAMSRVRRMSAAALLREP